MTLNEELIRLRQQIKEQEKGDKAVEERKGVFGGSKRFFRREPYEVYKNERMKLIALKTEYGKIKGEIVFYCRVLGARQTHE